MGDELEREIRDNLRHVPLREDDEKDVCDFCHDNFALQLESCREEGRERGKEDGKLWN